MQQLKKPIIFETAFDSYTANVVLGEGGAGRVYGATTPDGFAVAVKLLAEERASREKRSRFKNELAFLARNQHQNIVTVTDHGVIKSQGTNGPFYVMKRFDRSLRSILQTGTSPEQCIALLSQLLDGIEAAHLKGVIHRDLKPENVLYDDKTRVLAVADFGVASFTEDTLATIVETGPTQRLANFLYAAPEQRIPGRRAGVPADLYALGLMINEMFTREVPHGTEYKTISDVTIDFAFLDAVVSRLLRQDPTERLQSIAEVKEAIQRHKTEAVALQRLSEISQRVIPATEVDDPLAQESPKLVGADWLNNTLTLFLDKPVSNDWVNALGRMGNFSAVWGHGPEAFRFQGNRAVVQAAEHEVQAVVDHFKQWLPNATAVLKLDLEQRALREDNERKRKLQLERETEERRLRVLRGIKI